MFHTSAGQLESGLGDYSRVLSWFSVSQKSNSDKKQILKEAIRERFIERADVEFVFIRVVI